jgi:hypothetical protein
VGYELPVIPDDIVLAVHSHSRGLLNEVAQLLLHNEVTRGGASEVIEERSPKSVPVARTISAERFAELAGRRVYVAKNCIDLL